MIHNQTTPTYVTFPASARHDIDDVTPHEIAVVTTVRSSQFDCGV